MKQRILTGWTFTRALYVVMGTFVIIQSAMQHQWMGVLLGGYFAAMGIFSFGCASGSCFGSACSTRPNGSVKTDPSDIPFEEVKAK